MKIGILGTGVGGQTIGAQRARLGHVVKTLNMMTTAVVLETPNINFHLGRP
jgi:hypothetical protein